MEDNMQYIKPGLPLAITMLIAVWPAQASALARPEFLKNLPDKFSQVKGPGVKITPLGGGIAVSCEESEVNGEIMTATAGEVTFDFKGCNANSLGDGPKTILEKASFETCYLKEEEPVEAGLLLRVATVHLENVPIAGLLEAEGPMIGFFNEKTLTTFTLNLSQIGGDPTDTSCKANAIIKGAELRIRIAHGNPADGSFLMSSTWTTTKQHQLDK
jgi:hypothetical protein